MSGEQILDALERVDEELLYEAQCMRQRRKKSRWPLVSLAACLCLVIAGIIVAQPWKNQEQVNGSSGAEKPNQVETEIENGSAGVYVPPLDMDVGAEAAVEADMLSFFIHQGRIYVECGQTQNGAGLVGEKLGTADGSIDEWTPESGYVEGSGTAWGDFYTVNGYDPTHLLCMTREDGTVVLYWNNNDITVQTGGDVLENVFHLSGQVTGATMQGPNMEECTTISSLNDLNDWVEKLCAAPAQWDGDTAPQVQGYLYLENQDGVTVQLALCEGGKVGIDGLGDVSFQLDWTPIAQWKT